MVWDICTYRVNGRERIQVGELIHIDHRQARPSAKGVGILSARYHLKRRKDKPMHVLDSSLIDLFTLLILILYV